jgi:predicted nucleic acid-binding protein
VTVLDGSAAIDFLLGDGVAGDVEALFAREGTLAAPDLLVFEVLAVLRRDAQRETIAHDRARAAIEDLGDLALDLFPTLPFRDRAWELRENLTAADALVVALAERLGEPLATKDRGLASAARTHVRIETIELREAR